MDPRPLDAIANLIRLGTVAEVDHTAARCRVASGELLTAPLPWISMRAGTTRTWSAPSVGEQVVLLAPGGNLGCAVVLLGLYADAHPAPSADGTGHIALFADGAILSYDDATHDLRAILPGGGTATLVATGGVRIEGSVEIAGDVTVTGDVGVSGAVEAQGDVTGQGISLATHRHTGVTAGTATSAGPV